MKNVLIILTMVFATSTYASIPFTIPNDQVQLGSGKAVIESSTATVMSHKVEKMIHGTGTPTNLIKEFDIGSGNNPYLGYDNDAGSLVFSNDGILQKKIGSGSGGGAGGFSVLSNGGFDDGIDVNWTCTGATCTEAAKPLFGEQSLEFTGTATGDLLQSDLYDLADSDAPASGLFGNACEGRVYYIGGDGKMQLKAVDGNGDDLGQPVTLPEHKQGNYESIYFRCPTETPTTALNSIRLEIESLDATATATFDDMYLGQTIGLVTIVDAEVEEKILSADVTSSGDIADFTFTGLEVGKTYFLSGFIEAADNSGNPKLTAYSGASASGTNYGAIFYTENTVVSGADNQGSGVSLNFTAQSDTLYIYGFNIVSSAVVRGDGTKSESFLQLRRLVERQVFKNIPRVADNENVPSFRIGLGGVVEKDSFNIIDSCSLSGTSNETKTCTFTKPFLNTPIITSSPCSALDSAVSISSITTTNFAYNTRNLANSQNDREACFALHKQGDDYKTPTVQPQLVNQVTTNSGDPVKICRIFQNSQTSTASFESPDDCFGSGSRTTTGIYEINFASNYFKDASDVFCSCNVVSNAGQGRTCNFANATEAGVLSPSDTMEAYLIDHTNAFRDVGFNMICYGEQP